MGPLTQEDPIGIAGGLNLYGYANGDPINFSDPFGLCAPICLIPPAIVLGGALVGAGAWLMSFAASHSGADSGILSRALSRTRDRPQVHHVATDKNYVSASTGGPWTPRFEAIFEEGGMSLQDPTNKITVLGHSGPHPEAYHRAVFDRLVSATEGLEGDDYRKALVGALTELRIEVATPGTPLNAMISGR